MEKSYHIYDILPYQGIEENTLVMRDGRVAVLFEANGIEIDSWNGLDYDAFVSNFHKAIETLPDGVDLSKYDIYYHKNQYSQSEVQDIYKKNGYFIGKAAEMFSKNKGLFQKSYLVLTLAKAPKDQGAIEYKTLYAKLSMDSSIKLLKKSKESIKRVNEIANDFMRYFNSSIKLNRLSDDRINQFILEYLNLDGADDTEKYIRGGYDFSDKRFMNVGQKKVRILTLKKTRDDLDNFWPKDYGMEKIAQFTTAPTAQFLKIPHITIQTIKKRKGVDNRFTLEKTMASMQISSPLVDDFMRKAEVIHADLEDLVRNGDPVTLYNHTVLVWEESENDINNYDLTKTALTDLGQYNEESFDTANLFFSNLPGVAGDNFRDVLLPLSHCSRMMSFTANRASDEGGDLYTDRFGNAVQVDFFHPSLPAQNAVVVGPTGSGKSFAVGYQILSAFSRKEIQVIIDKGGTYRNLSGALGGEYYEYKEDDSGKLSFNPFYIQQDETGKYLLTIDKSEFLITLIEVLWKNTDKEILLSREEKSLFQELLPEYYLRVEISGEIPSLKSFVKFIQKKGEEGDKEFDEFFHLSSFVLCMKPFTDGAYKKLFDLQTRATLEENRLLCFEMDGIAQNKSLFSIMVLLIIEQVMDFLRNYPTVRKHLIIDEAWALFGSEMGPFMEYIYRTIRKMNGRGVVITQSANDLEKSPIGDVLVGNSYVNVILNHGVKSTDPLKRVLNLDDEEVARVRSMRLENDMENIGRELCIVRDQVGVQVFSLKAPIEVVPVLTSKPSERDLFNRLLKEVNLEREELINESTGMQKVELKQECVFEAIERFVKQIGNKN